MQNKTLHRWNSSQIQSQTRRDKIDIPSYMHDIPLSWLDTRKLVIYIYIYIILITINDKFPFYGTK